MLRLAGAGLAVLGVAAAVIFGGYEGGWWLRADSTQRQGELNRSSYGFQQAHRDELTSEIGAVYTASAQIASAADGQQGSALRAQRFAVLGQVCRTASEITDPLPAQQAQFVQANCSAGAADPSSSYAN
ncbi:hypothetical protein [Pseudonocardia sp. T1-2H]|uniref:hypothetical protein n=1 Tax=Pseudonocardia sp. T1-2H TaxID=3128899 RepID=UPI003100E895